MGWTEGSRKGAASGEGRARGGWFAKWILAAVLPSHQLNLGIPRDPIRIEPEYTGERGQHHNEQDAQREDERLHL